MDESKKLSTQFQYVSVEQAREILAEIGVELTMRQMKRAAETNPAGKRKLPFFVDPIEGKLKIEKQILLNTYAASQAKAMRDKL
ncbi:MAG: hypothetical protein V3V05_07700 [Pontiella sp.]